MADVARLAGVSHQTVSRVLNDPPSVSRETRRRVETAIVQLGYRRNAAAIALKTHRTSTIGVISVDTAEYRPARSIFCIEEAARAAGYFINFTSLRDVSRPGMRAALDHLTGACVDGVVVVAPVRAAIEAVEGLLLDVPLVMLETSEGADTDVTVNVDQVAGARLATRHLLDLGHKGVLHLRGPESWVEADARARGWMTEMARARAPVSDALVGRWSASSGYAAGLEVVRRPDVTAVFCANDEMSLGLMRALHEAGRSIPRDVSIVGFDDIPEAEYFAVPLTTVRQDCAEVGRRCIERLLSLIEGRPAPLREAIQPELVIRASTGPPPPHK